MQKSTITIKDNYLNDNRALLLFFDTDAYHSYRS